ncbi:MAG: hypothetical protein IM586_17260 [Pseudanabaena sp. M172S2SP2A07QC]|jgi:hypothetical protein|nr:hypothetical protein [Pseudanabaena sp. M172S2SP2A07QC]MCA6510261.1 hypothetical protein [Pseudanabaena sp. M109S1SP2A07QC]MCA6546689.1 hypothetical protein [Pseudanabaena sp. M152S2SP2A07QC]
MSTTNTTAQIASFLNVAPNAIKTVTEMAWVFCVVVKGCRARFVSKKVVKEVKMFDEKLMKIAGVGGDTVVINAKREKLTQGYIVRKGYDCHNIVIKINPVGKDCRYLQVNQFSGNERVEFGTAEYEAVCKTAFAFSAKELVASVSAWDTAPFPEAYAPAEACSYAV